MIVLDLMGSDSVMVEEENLNKALEEIVNNSSFSRYQEKVYLDLIINGETKTNSEKIKELAEAVLNHTIQRKSL